MAFNEWLLTQIEESGLSYSEIGRRAGFSHARISQVVNGDPASAEFCIAIAKALMIPPTTALRRAGYLSPIGIDDEEWEGLRYSYEILTDDGKRYIRTTIRALAQERESAEK